MAEQLLPRLQQWEKGGSLQLGEDLGQSSTKLNVAVVPRKSCLEVCVTAQLCLWRLPRGTGCPLNCDLPVLSQQRKVNSPPGGAACSWVENILLVILNMLDGAIVLTEDQGAIFYVPKADIPLAEHP